MTADPPQIDPQALRQAFGAFVTGVTIVTTRDASGAPTGFTANSFASVSLDPPLVLICLAETASSYPTFRDAGRFAVNVLSTSQREISTTFATRGADKFAGVGWTSGLTGAPLLEGATAWFDCSTHDIVPAGDHVILLGRVLAFGQRATPALCYCRGGYVTLGGDRGAFSPHAGGVRVSAIVARGDHVLLREQDGRAALPAALAFGPATSNGSLLGLLAGAGAATDLQYIFASYDLGDTHHVVYRGEAPADARPEPGWRFAPLDALPLGAMRPDEADILRRYADERAAHAYGRYVGDAITWSRPEGHD